MIMFVQKIPLTWWLYSTVLGRNEGEIMPMKRKRLWLYSAQSIPIKTMAKLDLIHVPIGRWYSTSSSKKVDVPIWLMAVLLSLMVLFRIFLLWLSNDPWQHISNCSFWLKVTIHWSCIWSSLFHTILRCELNPPRIDRRLGCWNPLN